MGKKNLPIIDLEKELIKSLTGRVAIYIDAANLEKSVQALGETPPGFRKGMHWEKDKFRWRVDYKKLRDFFSRNAKLASVTFYTARFETSDHDKFLAFLKNYGYRLVTKPVKDIKDHQAEIPHRKADFDVEISVDSVDWISHYDTFVLFSGDSDFVYLIEYLKRKGKRIIILSRRGHIAKELRTSRYVDYYQDIFKLKEVFLRRTS